MCTITIITRPATAQARIRWPASSQSGAREKRSTSPLTFSTLYVSRDSMSTLRQNLQNAGRLLPWDLCPRHQLPPFTSRRYLTGSKMGTRRLDPPAWTPITLPRGPNGQNTTVRLRQTRRPSRYFTRPKRFLPKTEVPLARLNWARDHQPINPRFPCSRDPAPTNPSFRYLEWIPSHIYRWDPRWHTRPPRHSHPDAQRDSSLEQAPSRPTTRSLASPTVSSAETTRTTSGADRLTAAFWDCTRPKAQPRPETVVLARVSRARTRPQALVGFGSMSLLHLAGPSLAEVRNLPRPKSLFQNQLRDSSTRISSESRWWTGPGCREAFACKSWLRGPHPLFSLCDMHMTI